MPKNSTKSLSIDRSGFKVLDDAQGIVEMIVSVFGNKDSYNERMMYGCYAKSLQERTPTGLFMHNWELPVARTLEAVELKAGDPRLPASVRSLGGLYIKAEYNLDTDRGRDAYSDIKKGIINEFSVGYKEVESSWNKELNCKDVTEAYLFEWSSVVAGANPSTSVISAKVAGETKAKEVFDRVKAMYLGEDAEACMSYSAICDLGYTLLWELARECCFGNQMSKADRIAMYSAGCDELRDLGVRQMEAMLPESRTEEIVEDLEEDEEYELRLEVEAHAPISVDMKSLLVIREGERVKELDALSDFAGRVSKKMSAMGVLRAKDRKKEGRVFSTANSERIDKTGDTLINIGNDLKEMVSVSKPEKALNFTSLIVKSKTNR